MNKYFILCLMSIVMPVVYGSVLLAQDIHYTQYNATPIAVNPAFTGMFDGSVRASVIYRNQWSDAYLPYRTAGGAADFPVVINKKGDYIAAGLQFVQDGAGDNELMNSSGSFSLAYHRFSGVTRYMRLHKGYDLAIGVSGSFGSHIFDAASIFFGNPNTYEHFLPGISSYRPTPVNYFLVNAGFSFSQSTGDKFNYTVGVASNGINQPSDPQKEATYQYAGINRSLTLSGAANWAIGGRFSLNPSVFYLSRGFVEGLETGTELQYFLKNPKEQWPERWSVFAGVFERTGSALSFTAGVQSHSLKVGIGYDYMMPSSHVGNQGNGAIECTLRYVAPTKMLYARNRLIPSEH